MLKLSMEATQSVQIQNPFSVENHLDIAGKSCGAPLRMIRQKQSKEHM